MAHSYFDRYPAAHAARTRARTLRCRNVKYLFQNLASDYSEDSAWPPASFPTSDASRRHAPSRCATQSDPPRLRASSVKRLPPMSQQKSRGKRGKSGFDHKQRKTGNTKASKKKKGRKQRGRGKGDGQEGTIREMRRKGFRFFSFFHFSRARKRNARVLRAFTKGRQTGM